VDTAAADTKLESVFAVDTRRNSVVLRNFRKPLAAAAVVVATEIESAAEVVASAAEHQPVVVRIETILEVRQRRIVGLEKRDTVADILDEPLAEVDSDTAASAAVDSRIAAEPAAVEERILPCLVAVLAHAASDVAVALAESASSSNHRSLVE